MGNGYGGLIWGVEGIGVGDGRLFSKVVLAFFCDITGFIGWLLLDSLPTVCFCGLQLVCLEGVTRTSVLVAAHSLGITMNCLYSNLYTSID